MSLANEQRDRGVRRLFLTAVVLPVLLAAIAGSWLVWQIRCIADAAGWIDHSDRVIALVSEVQKGLVDQEMGLRAFLFTEEPLFLEPYRRAHPIEDLDDLEQLVADDPGEAEALHALRAGYQAWRQKAEEAIASPAQGRSVAGMAARRADIDELREESAGIVTQEKSTRLLRTRRFERRTRSTALGAVIVLALLAGASSLSSRGQIRLIGALMKRERDALAKAQEALRAKDTFLTNLSHELRTPLTPILAWAAMARAGRLRGEALERALLSIERNAKAESQIVDDLLDISRIATGKLRIAPEPVDPLAVVLAATEVVALSARAKGITLETDSASPLPAILGDPARLQQIVWNLANNAVKFTPRGGRVEVRVDRYDAGVRIRVADNGAGIPADFLPHLFEYFRQADASATRAHGGLGLGLAIAKHLVELHGGEIEAESAGPGQGATFTVRLPVPAPAPATVAPSGATPI